jgi:hypothetical protein
MTVEPSFEIEKFQESLTCEAEVYMWAEITCSRDAVFVED